MPTLRRKLYRLRERAILVLVIHPAELAEFSVGLISFAAGLTLTFAGAPGPHVPWQATAGGIALASFGLPQMFAAIHGRLRLRHASNVIGCAAALGNFLRCVHQGAHVATAFFVALFALCFWFWVRTDIQSLLARSLAADLDVSDAGT